MYKSLLRVEHLSVDYKLNNGEVNAVRDVSFSLNQGDSLGIIGESGSGKTSLAMALMGLIKEPGEVRGNVYYEDVDINSLSKREIKSIRWNKIALVFQNSLDVLNPLLTIYEQISEVIVKHLKLSKENTSKRVKELLKMVGLSIETKDYYPHQLSGGMRQRVLIAMALACDPEVLIVDEPTTALDAVYKNEIIKLLSELHEEKKFALLVISHELETISHITSKVNVMYSGCILEKGITSEVLKNPMHTYTRGLLDSSPVINPYRDLWGIPGESGGSKESGCPFRKRCTQSIEICNTRVPKLEYVSLERQVACHRGGIVTLLEGKNINKTYKNKKTSVKACENCSIKIRSGEIVALIGESGSGKTTLAGILSGTILPQGGEVVFEEKLVSGNNCTSIKNGMQIVFQDPFSSINERFSIEEAISEPLRIIKEDSYEKIKIEVKKALEEVQLPNDENFLNRKCYTLSGGQRQRVSIARSLVMRPKLLIADEITSMLDPSTKANIIRLLKGLQNKNGFSMLYITHDLPIARKIADRVYVMHNGKIVEQGIASKIFSAPADDYTKKLVKKGMSEFN